MKLKSNKKFLLLGFFILVNFALFPFVLAYSQTSGYSTAYVNNMGAMQFSSGQSLKLDESMCQQGTDFIVQVSPLGCENSPVRSDLLAEENVNVFCKLVGLQINPLIKVDQIDAISFDKEYPREVLGIGYMPAQSALGYYPGEQSEINGNLAGSLILNNLGYMVVTLRRQPVESALTNCEKTALGLSEVCWVEGNLTATFRYDIQNSFGIGSAMFYLPEMDENDWQDNYLRYGFWKGRGYLRATSIEDNGATIAVYSDNSVLSGALAGEREYRLAKYSSNIQLDVGKESQKIFLPGISPCLGSLTLRLEGIENPDTVAQLRVNEDYFEIRENEYFLENQCRVKDLDKNGINSDVTISCVNQKDFHLRIFPRVNLEIDGKSDSYGVGQFLYQSKEDKTRFVYLGYVGTFEDTENVEDLFVYLVSLPQRKDMLSSSELTSISNYAEAMVASTTGLNIGAKLVEGTMYVGRWTVKGENSFYVPYKDIVLNPVIPVEGTRIILKGFADVDNNGFMSVRDTLYTPILTPELGNKQGTFNYFFREIKGEDGQYSLLEEPSSGEKSKLYLTTSVDGEIPKFFLNIKGTVVGEASYLMKVGEFVGYNNNVVCSTRQACSEYKLDMATLRGIPAEYVSFFDGVVGAKVLSSNGVPTRLVIQRAVFSEFEYDGDYTENYVNAVDDFETILNSYPGEREDVTSQSTYGELALIEEIKLAENLGQKKTMLELCKRFQEDYPESLESLSMCRDLFKIANSEISTKEISINNLVKEISFEGISEPSVEEYSATVAVRGPEGVKTYVLRKNKQVSIAGLRGKDGDINSEYMMLMDLDVDGAKIYINVGDVPDSAMGIQYSIPFVKGDKYFPKSIPQPYGDYTFTVTGVTLNKVAKVSVSAGTDFARSTSTFPFKIGIEKRAIQLSPEKATEKIEKNNKSIESWEKAISALKTVESGMIIACKSTWFVLQAINFISNMNGKSVARQEVMTAEGGWNDKCIELMKQDPRKYTSLEDCIYENSEQIEEEVMSLYRFTSLQNGIIKSLQDSKSSIPFINRYAKNVSITIDSVYNKFQSSALSAEQKQKLQSLELDKLSNILKSDSLTERGVYSVDDLKEIQLYAFYLERVIQYPNQGSTRLTSTYLQRFSSVVTNVQKNSERYYEADRFATLNNLNTNHIIQIETKQSSELKYTYQGDTKGTNNKYLPSDIPIGTPIQTIELNGVVYTLVLDNSDPRTSCLPVKKSSVTLYNTPVYATPVPVISKDTPLIYDPHGVLVTLNSNPTAFNALENLCFIKVERTDYQNPYKSSYGSSSDKAVLSYHDSSSFTCRPAVVPFDLGDGWYAGIKSATMPSYDDSGVLKRFYLCNVGSNGVEQFQVKGFGDDLCTEFVIGNPAGMNFNLLYPLSSREVEALYNKARAAVQAAQNACQRGKAKAGQRVAIGNGVSVLVGSPAYERASGQCTDTMSPKQCNLIFNLCDPVICPSSRCDLGGKYPVQDVVQSGIIGGLALCLPNWKVFGGDVYIPICISGVRAGAENWVSVKKDYVECLQKQIDTGESVGLCDAMQSIYFCKLFFEYSMPVIKLFGETLIDRITGQGTVGGGEYNSGISSAFKNLETSINYFTQYYSDSSNRAFSSLTMQDVTTGVCGRAFSAVYADSGTFLGNLITPYSPAQYTGTFSESMETTSTNPPISHYKVTYHIYAGTNAGVYYNVYLRGTGGAYYQGTGSSRTVGSGYIAKGDSVSESRDFTAPSGYSELCIVANGQEKCGFKEVSTSFAINRLSDLYLEQQASQKDITTSDECTSGTVSLYSLMNIADVQGAAESLLNPDLAVQGITRICSTQDPGLGDYSNSGTENARWVKVGYCDEERVGCWIDTDSVKNAIKSLDIQDDTLDELGKAVNDIEENYMSVDNFQKAIDEINSLPNNKEGLLERIDIITSLLENKKILYNNQKAKLYLLRGEAYAGLAKYGYDEFIEEFKKAEELRRQAQEEAIQEGAIPEGETEPQTLFETFDEIYESKIFTFKYGNPLVSVNEICYKFSGSKWYWNSLCNNEKSWVEIGAITDGTTMPIDWAKMRQRDKDLIDSLNNKGYFEGLKLLIDRTAEDDASLIFFGLKLNTPHCKMDEKLVFDYSSMGEYYRYLSSNNYWQMSLNGKNWQTEAKYIDVFFYGDGRNPLSVKGMDLYEGAAILFDPGSSAIREAINSVVDITSTANVPCAAGRDMGVKTGYYSGTPIQIRLCDVSGIDVNSQISGEVQSLIEDAKAAGYDFTGSGGFRTMEEQTYLYNQNCDSSGCNPPTAKPGYSKHQMGLAIDFSINGQSVKSGSAAFNWLSQNAARYGLINYAPEPWHWYVKNTQSPSTDVEEPVTAATSSSTSEMVDDALFTAAESGDLNTVKSLVEAGVDVNAQHDYHLPALMLASENGYLEIVQYLVEHGADVNAKDDVYEYTALMMASSESGNLEIVKYLVEHGADVNAKDFSGHTVLMWGYDSTGNLDTIKYLVEQGADVNAARDDGKTALMGTSILGRLDVAKYLVEQGADVNAKDNAGKTALDWAEGMREYDIVNYLKSKGAVSGTANVNPAPITTETIEGTYCNPGGMTKCGAPGTSEYEKKFVCSSNKWVSQVDTYNFCDYRLIGGTACTTTGGKCGDSGTSEYQQYFLCQNGKWVSQGMSDGKCNYILVGGKSCTSGTKCGNSDTSEFQNYFICQNGKWVSQSYVSGKCGYS